MRLILYDMGVVGYLRRTPYNPERNLMKRTFAMAMVFVLALVVSGCAQKTASEKLQDDMNKAANQMKKDINKL